MIKLPKHIERRMPKEVPVLRAQDFEGKSLIEWIDLVFGKHWEVISRIFVKMRASVDLFVLYIRHRTDHERRCAASAWNAIMGELGYTEPLEGRWHP